MSKYTGIVDKVNKSVGGALWDAAVNINRVVDYGTTNRQVAAERSKSPIYAITTGEADNDRFDRSMSQKRDQVSDMHNKRTKKQGEAAREKKYGWGKKRPY